MPDIFYDAQAPRIPYPGLADQIFHPTSRRQKLIPLLGAGASLSDASAAGSGAPPPTPSTDQLDRVCQTLGLTSPTARLLIRIAAYIASHVESAATSENARPDPFIRIRDKAWPPSSGELAEVLAHRSTYEAFEDAIARVRNVHGDPSPTDIRRVLEAIAASTGIVPEPSSLLAVSSYFEYTLPRVELTEILRQIFARKQTPTRLHRLIARAAAHFMALAPLSDYLIVTTNYDELIERALAEAGTPFCVLTVGRDRKVYTRFAPSVRKHFELDENEYAQFEAEHQGKSAPSLFTFQKPRPLVVVYKIHGCAHEPPSYDSVVISDEDYVDYISHMADNRGAIPAPVTPLLEGKSFLFLGYRFADWNVRSIYRSVVDRRSAAGDVVDYAVMRDISAYEMGFFSKRRIHILKTDLATFVDRIEDERPSGSPPPPAPAPTANDADSGC